MNFKITIMVLEFALVIPLVTSIVILAISRSLETAFYEWLGFTIGLLVIACLTGFVELLFFMRNQLEIQQDATKRTKEVR